MNLNSCFSRFRSILPAALLVILAGTASAHPGHPGHEITGIGWGLAHPFTGMDHLLAMVAVGLWAVQMGRRALWVLPLSFVTAMAVGGVFGMNGMVLPQVEPMIIGSALGLGAMVAMAARLPLGLSAGIVAVSAFFHGQVHGVEMPAASQGLTAFGILASTAVLHAAGIVVGLALQKVAAGRAVRVCGAAIAVAAAALAAF